ncbi:MAG: HAD family hydrolase [Candidatus Eisenbacteria bacterium]|nr:HAD family hydrolase [Candidatus Eisenbacteria bacterium]
MLSKRSEGARGQKRTSWAVFVDRDGTVIEEIGYQSDPDGVKLIPDAAASLSKLNKLGIPVVVISNQAGVARGLFTVGDLDRVHDRFVELLGAEGAFVDAAYYCPHHPEFGAECDCRKPKPGLLLKASEDMGIDLGRSFMVGDRLIDLQAGKAAGASTVFVRTGYGEREMQEHQAEIMRTADRVCDDLAQAVEWILDEKS